MPTEKERKDIQKATIYDLRRQGNLYKRGTVPVA